MANSDNNQEVYWYLWVDLSERPGVLGPASLVENHEKIRRELTELAKKYEHIETHDGVWKLPKLPGYEMICGGPRLYRFNIYFMARTEKEHKDGLYSLEKDLQNEDEEDKKRLNNHEPMKKDLNFYMRRIIGPTNDCIEIRLRGDHLKESKKTISSIFP